MNFSDFLGKVDKILLASAGDTDWIPGLERFHMPWSNSDPAPQPLSPCSRAQKPQLLRPRATTSEAQAPRAGAPHEE